MLELLQSSRQSYASVYTYESEVSGSLLVCLSTFQLTIQSLLCFWVYEAMIASSVFELWQLFPCFRLGIISLKRTK